jgi:hypothetical protein
VSFDHLREHFDAKDEQEAYKVWLLRAKGDPAEAMKITDRYHDRKALRLAYIWNYGESLVN